MTAAQAGCVVVIGGTAGLGREIAAHYAAAGRDVVLTGRDQERAAKVAAEIGGRTRGVALELAVPGEIADALGEVGRVDHVVLSAIDRDENTVADFDIRAAVHLVTLKLVGYAEVVHALRSRLSPAGSVLLFGGQALNRPYPGSTTVSTVNGGVVGMVHTLASELAPIRVNGIHPGIVGDSPAWADKDVSYAVARTPIGRTVTMEEVVDATLFLLDNGGVNGHNLVVEGGALVR